MHDNKPSILFVDSNPRRRKKLSGLFSTVGQCYYWDFINMCICTDQNLAKEILKFDILFLHHTDRNSFSQELKIDFTLWYSGSKGFKKDVPENECQFTRTIFEGSLLSEEEVELIMDYYYKRKIGFENNSEPDYFKKIKPVFLKTLKENNEAALLLLLQIGDPSKVNWDTISLPEELNHFYEDWQYFCREVKKNSMPNAKRSQRYKELFIYLRKTMLNE